MITKAHTKAFNEISEKGIKESLKSEINSQEKIYLKDKTNQNSNEITYSIDNNKKETSFSFKFFALFIIYCSSSLQ